MTGIQLVVALVREHGSACIDDIHPECGDMTRSQVRKALDNARARGFLRNLGPSGQKGARGRGTVLYEAVAHVPPPADEADAPPLKPRGRYGYIGRVSSVWELGGVEHAA